MTNPTPRVFARRLHIEEPFHSPPVVPLPVLDDRPPLLLVFDQADLGIELAYERDPEPGGTRVRATTRETNLYWVPRLVAVFAAADGVVIYAREHTNGHTIVLEHAGGWTSVYGQLEHMTVMPTDRLPRRETRVEAGDILGYLGPSHGKPLRPLHFELWKWDGDDYEQIDPLRFIRHWRHLPWSQ
jgi:hypothetical protein